MSQNNRSISNIPFYALIHLMQAFQLKPGNINRSVVFAILFSLILPLNSYAGLDPDVALFFEDEDLQRKFNESMSRAPEILKQRLEKVWKPLQISTQLRNGKPASDVCAHFMTSFDESALMLSNLDRPPIEKAMLYRTLLAIPISVLKPFPTIYRDLTKLYLTKRMLLKWSGFLWWYENRLEISARSISDYLHQFIDEFSQIQPDELPLIIVEPSMTSPLSIKGPEIAYSNGYTYKNSNTLEQVFGDWLYELKIDEIVIIVKINGQYKRKFKRASEKLQVFLDG